MEVSAKTGVNIKEFFKDLAYEIVMGNKKAVKEEPRPQPQLPPQHQNQSVNLTTQNHKNSDKKDKKKGCCWCIYLIWNLINHYIKWFYLLASSKNSFNSSGALSSPPPASLSAK